MVGEFKDDCLQKHKHELYHGNDVQFNKTSTDYGSEIHTIPFGDNNTFYDYLHLSNNDGRYNDITHGKRKGVKYIIKVL